MVKLLQVRCAEIQGLLDQLLVIHRDDLAQLFLVESGHIKVLISSSEVSDASEEVVEIAYHGPQISVLDFGDVFSVQ